MNSSLLVRRIENEVTPNELIACDWRTTDVAVINKYWSGEMAPPERCFRVECTWSTMALNLRFESAVKEPLIVSSEPDLTTKAIGLWERDVCEIFIAPDRGEPRKYYEFEVAPTGEWLDLAIDMTRGERITDVEYESAMQTAARIHEGCVLMAIQIPWTAFGKKPDAGDVWLGNIFRCVGKELDRGYLAWRPTMTEIPNFHVPSAFGKFEFTDTPV